MMRTYASECDKPIAMTLLYGQMVHPCIPSVPIHNESNMLRYWASREDVEQKVSSFRCYLVV